MKSAGVRLIRYADDFLLFAKSQEDSESALRIARSILREDGLSLKEDKTAVHELAVPFEYLGISFLGRETSADTDRIASVLSLRKPLYVLEPYVFLVVAGETVEVRRNGDIIASVPFVRVSEIIVMGQSTLSSTLLRRCVSYGIPVVLALSDGYYAALFRPDSKRFYDICIAHAGRYGMTPPEAKLRLARELVQEKLLSVLPLFRRKLPHAAYAAARSRMERAVADLCCAPDIAAVRGIEGAAARVSYETLNLCISDPVFHIVRRHRKRRDRINSLLNFGYYLLFSAVNTTVRSVGLDPYLGFLHAPADRYESLVCDIEELFRHRVLRMIVRALNLRTITADDFIETDKGYFLTSEAARRFVAVFADEMRTRAEGEELTFEQSIRARTESVRRWAVDGEPLSFATGKERELCDPSPGV